MRWHPFVFGMISLAALSSRADVVSESAAHAISPEEVLVAAPEPRYVAPTLRDRIGRVWAPVHINGLGPFRLVLDTGANGTVVTHSVALQVGAPILASTMRVLGVTGSSIVPSMHVDSIEIGVHCALQSTLGGTTSHCASASTWMSPHESRPCARAPEAPAARAEAMRADANRR